MLAFETLPYLLPDHLASKRLIDDPRASGGLSGDVPWACLARASFVVPAIPMSVVGRGFAVHLLNQIARPAGQHDPLAVAATTSAGL